MELAWYFVGRPVFWCGPKKQFPITSPHLTSPHLTSPHLTSPHLTSPHLTSPHLTSPHLTSPHLSPVWDGMFMMALSLCPDLSRLMGIPENHAIGYAMAFGEPAVEYHRTVQRGSAKVNVVRL